MVLAGQQYGIVLEQRSLTQIKFELRNNDTLNEWLWVMGSLVKQAFIPS